MGALNLTPEPEQEKITADKIELLSRIRSGAGWFYWIAGLSIINSAILLFGGRLNFIIGLGFTQLVDGILIGASGGEPGNVGVLRIIGFVLDLVIAGIFILIGVFSAQAQVWAFLVGIIFYSLDAVLYLLIGDFLPFGFHVFALFFIVRGFLAARQIKAV
ncbi:MAG TPA: hypothetical protein VGC76_15585 [Pyrinomonadaceae bacterium]|jgi:hypothetical protein